MNIQRTISRLLLLWFALSMVSSSPSRVCAQVTEPHSATSTGEVPGDSLKPATRDEDHSAIDPSSAPRTTIVLSPSLRFGARFQLEVESERDFDLDNKVEDGLSTLEPKSSFAFSFDPMSQFQIFLSFELSKKYTLEEGEGRRKKDRLTKLEPKDAFLFVRGFMDGLSLQIGRQRVKDEREWLYDQRLDGLGLYYQLDDFVVEAIASREGILWKDILHSGGESHINNYLLRFTYLPQKDLNVSAYSFARNDRSPDGHSPIFYGLHSSGELVNKLDYWAEVAHVRGHDGVQKIRGVGFDIGTTYQLPLPLKFSATLGYAFGRGDRDPTDDVDESFRQTGLQDNKSKFNGVTRFKYYGELFDPELSNLVIITAGIGLRPSRRSSIDFVFHNYRQDIAFRRIRDSALDDKPKGRDRELGNELDLIAGYRDLQDLDFVLKLGYFLPGKAFSSGSDTAFFVGFKVRYNL